MKIPVGCGMFDRDAILMGRSFGCAMFKPVAPAWTVGVLSWRDGDSEADWQFVGEDHGIRTDTPNNVSGVMGAILKFLARAEPVGGFMVAVALMIDGDPDRINRQGIQVCVLAVARVVRPEDASRPATTGLWDLVDAARDWYEGRFPGRASADYGAGDKIAG